MHQQVNCGLNWKKVIAKGLDYENAAHCDRSDLGIGWRGIPVGAGAINCAPARFINRYAYRVDGWTFDRSSAALTGGRLLARAP